MKKIIISLGLFLVVGGAFLYLQNQPLKSVKEKNVSNSQSIDVVNTYTNTAFNYAIDIPKAYTAISEYDGMPYDLKDDTSFFILGLRARDTNTMSQIEVETFSKDEVSQDAVYRLRLEEGDNLEEVTVNIVPFKLHHFSDSTWVGYLYETDSAFYLFKFDEQNNVGQELVKSFRLLEL